MCVCVRVCVHVCVCVHMCMYECTCVCMSVWGGIYSVRVGIINLYIDLEIRHELFTIITLGTIVTSTVVSSTVVSRSF